MGLTAEMKSLVQEAWNIYSSREWPIMPSQKKLYRSKEVKQLK
jgi:hypothetical protein